MKMNCFFDKLSAMGVVKKDCQPRHDRDGNAAKVLKIEGAISFKAAGLTVPAL